VRLVVRPQEGQPTFKAVLKRQGTGMSCSWVPIPVGEGVIRVNVTSRAIKLRAMPALIILA
jgi:hypothetical protein